MSNTGGQDKRTGKYNHLPEEYRNENGTKESSREKGPDRLARESIVAAGGHRRKSQGMWYWMEIVKECFLPKMDLEPGIRMGKLGRGTEEGVGLKTIGTGVAAGALAIVFAYLFVAPQESVPKRAWPQQSRDSAVS